MLQYCTVVECSAVLLFIEQQKKPSESLIHGPGVPGWPKNLETWNNLEFDYLGKKTWKNLEFEKF